MADKQEFEIDGKQISQLRVVDLKQELDKRGLSKSGSKKDLLDRLKKQLQLESLQQAACQDEGHVPNLGLQDDAIAEQSDVIKEYLAKQQEIFEIQKAVRRRVEMEEELKGQTSEPDSASEQQISVVNPDSENSESTPIPDPTPEQDQECSSVTEPENAARISSPAENKKTLTYVDVKEDESEEMKKESLQSKEITETSCVEEQSDSMATQSEKVELHSQSDEKDNESQNEVSKENKQGSCVPEENENSFDVSKEDKNNQETNVSHSKKVDLQIQENVIAAVSQVNDEKPDCTENKTLRRRIKREFFQPETSRDATTNLAKNSTIDSASSEKLTLNDSDKMQQNMDISQESWAEQETDNSNISRGRSRSKRNPGEDNSEDHHSRRNRSNSSSSSSSPTRETPERKDSIQASSSSSSSDENSKSPRRHHNDSNSASSSESPEKGQKYSPIVYSENNELQKIKTPGSETQNSYLEEKKEEMESASQPDENLTKQNTPSVLQIGEATNDESIDVDNKADEDTFDRQESDDRKKTVTVRQRSISVIVSGS